eukprot:GHVU01131360.1.p1 GENE.GHVU01131360.1~~GHVU01131360.1.p1  ORF type:complete len:242 (-),score=24.81 GHVU01131360.1:838-1563(-)
MNDLPNQIINACTISYADDTTIYISNKIIEDLYISLYDNLQILDDYCNANKLSINLEKTKYILFQPNRKISDRDIPTIEINNATIERVTTFNFLGIQINEKLTWQEQTTKICNKLKQNLYLINNIKSILPKCKLIDIYYAHFHSHLTYGIRVWGPMLNNTQINKIYQEQKKALRYIDKKSYDNINYNNSHKHNKILKLEDIINLEILHFGLKINYNLIPNNILKYLRLQITVIIIQEIETM